MSSARLNQLVNSAWLNHDSNAAIDAYNQWQVSHCYHPIMQTIYDCHTQTMRTIQIPCGSCYHCLESKINEWCTRMYAHAEDFKHVYFVTLTYRSFTNISTDVSRLILNKLQDAVWHFDNLNTTFHASWNPCLLIKKHYQDFLKRLRKNTGYDDITYVLSGEYGHQFGRPHFHLILFSNNVITRSDIVRAWSVALWKQNNGSFTYKRNQSKDGCAYYFPIGRVDFHDLVTNGSFNTSVKIKVDGRFLNASNCFAYVCKYVCKRDKANLNRVRLAYDSLFNTYEFVTCYGNEFQSNLCEKYFLKAGYSYEFAADLSNKIKQFKYEKTIFQPDQFIYSHGLEQIRSKSVFGHIYSYEFYPKVYIDFRADFSPFCEFSRGTPIGSLYASRHLQEFKEDVYTKPILQDKGFVVPAYFRRKAQNAIYGLRVASPSLYGISFRKSGLVDLYRRFTKSLEDGSMPYKYFSLSGSKLSIKMALSHPSFVYKDEGTGERILLFDGFCHRYKFNRHTRNYDVTSTVPVSSFVRDCLHRLKNEFERYSKQLNSSISNLRNQDAALLKLTDMGIDSNLLITSFEQKTSNYLHQSQEIYHEITNSVE